MLLCVGCVEHADQLAFIRRSRGDQRFESRLLQQRVGRTPRGSWLLHTSVRFGLTKNFTLTVLAGLLSDDVSISGAPTRRTRSSAGPRPRSIAAAPSRWARPTAGRSRR